MTKHYPSWICTECAVKNGGSMPEDHMATWHMGVCGVCSKEKAVTEPRDFRYPKIEGFE